MLYHQHPCFALPPPTALDDEFDAHKTKHGRKYSDKEHNVRRNNFRHNKQ
jgi:hypothetical protein